MFYYLIRKILTWRKIPSLDKSSHYLYLAGINITITAKPFITSKQPFHFENKARLASELDTYTILGLFQAVTPFISTSAHVTSIFPDKTQALKH